MAAAAQYAIRIITAPEDGEVGAIWYGPSDKVEFYHPAYGNFWDEVGHLPQHRAALARLRAEADDCPPSQAVRLRAMVDEYDAQVRSLEHCAPLAAARYETAAELGNAIPGYGRSGAYTPHPEHAIARGDHAKE